MRGYPAEKEVNKEAYDADALERFWALSEELTGYTTHLRRVKAPSSAASLDEE